MPLERFRSMEEARQALLRPGDERLLARIRGVWSFARRLAPGSAPRGLRRFGTLEEARLDREQWSRDRAHALRAARRPIES